jgi:hypothetical protein
MADKKQHQAIRRLRQGLATEQCLRGTAFEVKKAIDSQLHRDLERLQKVYGSTLATINEAVRRVMQRKYPEGYPCAWISEPIQFDDFLQHVAEDGGKLTFYPSSGQTVEVTISWDAINEELQQDVG